jgi:hypothetical protein
VGEVKAVVEMVAEKAVATV